MSPRRLILGPQVAAGLCAVLVGCPLVSDEDLAARLDLDGDGVSRPEDCDDNDPDVTTRTFYADGDGDGYGIESVTTVACTASPGFAPVAGDCDDTDSAINPDGIELCNGDDDDCDGTVDGASAYDALEVFPDADGDGWGDESGAIIACLDDDATLVGQDCDDDDAEVYPGANDTWYDGVDSDCDGEDDNDADGDGHASADHGGDDCDDRDDWVSPSATETCGNGVDDDCDGVSQPCALEGEVPLEDATLTVTGSQAYQQLGAALAWAGDLDGDGDDEAVIGAPSANVANTRDGGVYVLHGPLSGTHDLDELTGPVLYGAAASASLGTRLAPAGDRDGDGADDLLIVGQSTPTAPLVGTVYLVHGPITGTAAVSSADLAYTGEVTLQQLGVAGLVGTADVDGDGTPDTVGTVSRWDYTTFDTGGFAVFLGAPDGTTAIGAADATVQASNDHGFGIDGGMGTGDVDGDGIDDVLVGTGSYAASASTEPGWVAVFAGPLSGDIDPDDADLIFSGDQAGDAFGAALTTGDLDGDGHADVVIGAPNRSSDSGADDAGTAWVFLGTTTADRSTDDADASIETDLYSTRLGRRLAVIDDVDGDGNEDLMVNGYGCTSCAQSAGATYVMSAATSGALLATDARATLMGVGAYDYAGDVLGGSGDFTGDGYPDLLVSAPQANRTGAQNGEAYMILGGPSE